MPVERFGPMNPVEIPSPRSHVRVVRDEFGTMDLATPLPDAWRPEEDRDPRCAQCPDALIWVVMVVMAATLGALAALQLDDLPTSAPSPVEITPTVTVDTSQPRWSE